MTYPCVGAERLAIDGVELPLVEMFLSVDEIEFFWWPGADWTPEQVAAFFALLARLLALAPTASLRPDPRYTAANRERLGELIGAVIGDPRRLDYGDGQAPPQR